MLNIALWRGDAAPPFEPPASVPLPGQRAGGGGKRVAVRVAAAGDGADANVDCAGTLREYGHGGRRRRLAGARAFRGSKGWSPLASLQCCTLGKFVRKRSPTPEGPARPGSPAGTCHERREPHRDWWRSLTEAKFPMCRSCSPSSREESNELRSTRGCHGPQHPGWASS